MKIKLLQIILIFFSILYFFLGFFLEENSAGAGGLSGDLIYSWRNLQTFRDFDLLTAIKYTGGLYPEFYQGSRAPTLYIFQSILNPFLTSQNNYIRSVFILSLTAPIIFYYCLKCKFFSINKILILLLACTLLLSPYFRTSSYWGLEENYGIIFSLVSFFFLNKFLTNYKILEKKYLYIFCIVFFSSFAFYFDQKYLIIPILCFLEIYSLKKNYVLKFYTFLLYLIFSIPFIYLIKIWGNIIPVSDSYREVGTKFHPDHIFFTIHIIGFYFCPLIFFKKNIFKKIFNYKINYILFILLIFYLFYAFIFMTHEDSLLGKGYLFKLSLLIFENIFYRKIFLILSFFILSIVIIAYLEGSFKNILIIFYLLSLSFITWPFYQEYLDPFVLILATLYFDKKIFINNKSVFFLYSYLFLFLMACTFYYKMKI
jgi:hypothetical protein